MVSNSTWYYHHVLRTVQLIINFGFRKNKGLVAKLRNFWLVDIQIVWVLVQQIDQNVLFWFMFQNELATFDAALEVVVWDQDGLLDVIPIIFFYAFLWYEKIFHSYLFYCKPFLSVRDLELQAFNHPYFLFEECENLIDHLCILKRRRISLLLKPGFLCGKIDYIGSSTDKKAIVTIIIFIQQRL